MLTSSFFITETPASIDSIRLQIKNCLVSCLLSSTQHGSAHSPPEQKRHQALPAGIRNDPCSLSVGLKSVILYFRPNSIPSILRVSAIVAKSRINLELHPTNLRKLLTSEAVVGRLASFTARTFSPYVQHRVLGRDDHDQSQFVNLKIFSSATKLLTDPESINRL